MMLCLVPGACQLYEGTTRIHHRVSIINATSRKRQAERERDRKEHEQVMRQSRSGEMLGIVGKRLVW
jgi:hypothetical protein